MRKALFQISLTILFTLFFVNCKADVPARPQPIVIASENGAYFFKMIPAKWSRKGRNIALTEDAYGIAYKVEMDGSFSEIWKVTGWYSNFLFLSNDGLHLVRIDAGPFGSKPEKKDTAISFYFKGELLKKYSTADLVEDERAVIQSISSYMWLAMFKMLIDKEKVPDPEARLRLDASNIFHLKTIDGIVYEFDVLTGDVKLKKRPNKGQKDVSENK